MRLALASLAIAFALAGCGKSVNKRAMAMMDVAEAPPAAPSQAEAPQIAYSYSINYDFERSDIAAVQSKHIALCAGLGITRCRVTKTDVSGGSEGLFGSTVNMLIDARLAGAFQRQLDAIATSAGGTIYERHMTAEDVSKQIVDTNAKVRAKQALADRLLKLIGTSNGKVGELVEAERAFATAQEELDAARAWQAQLHQRVSMSELQIYYRAGATTGTLAPIRDSLRDGGRTFAASVAAALSFTLAAIPWAALLVGVVWLGRQLGWLRWLRPPWRRRQDTRLED